MSTAVVSSLDRRLARLEAACAIRAIMARYMALCDTLGPNTAIEDLGALFTIDAIWAGKGARYGAAFGTHRGRAAIVAMLGAYRGPPAHFAMNAHYLCSETITVDDEVALGGWMMLQCSTYADGRADLRSARLSVSFANDDGQWRISRFETENLFSRPVDHWDDSAPIPLPTDPGD